MDAQVQPHVVSKQVAQAPLPGVGGSSGHPRNLLDSVLGAGVVTWDAHLCDDPTGQAGGGGGGSGGQAGAGGLRVDPEQMQQYGISQVCACVQARAGTRIGRASRPHLLHLSSCICRPSLHVWWQQVVLEGPVVNTAVTGPAAAVALMLMYLKTGDADVAACFKVRACVRVGVWVAVQQTRGPGDRRSTRSWARRLRQVGGSGRDAPRVLALTSVCVRAASRAAHRCQTPRTRWTTCAQAWCWPHRRVCGRVCVHVCCGCTWLRTGQPRHMHPSVCARHRVPPGAAAAHCRSGWRRSCRRC
jgi:hypothetical protein